MKQSKTNIPMNGSYYKFRPLTSYEFYILSECRPKRLIRIGKKFSVAELRSQRIDKFSKKRGRHRPNHFVNVRDVPKGFIEGTFLHGFPTPLLSDALIDSEHIEIEDTGKKTIQLPTTKLYPFLENFG